MFEMDNELCIHGANGGLCPTALKFVSGYRKIIHDAEDKKRRGEEMVYLFILFFFSFVFFFLFLMFDIAHNLCLFRLLPLKRQRRTRKGSSRRQRRRRRRNWQMPRRRRRQPWRRRRRMPRKRRRA
jgi:hypothetical protein